MGFLIDMIDVGYGDSFLLTMDNSNGKEVHVLIDGGESTESGKLIAYLSKYTNEHLSLIIATHLDDDHIGGLIEVVKRFSVGEFIINMPGTFKEWFGLKAIYEAYGAKAFSKKHLIESLQTANTLAELLEYRKIKTSSAYQGRYWNCDDVTLRVLNPTAEQVNAAWAEALLKESRETIVNESLYGVESAVPKTTDSNNAGIVIQLEYKNDPYGLFAADVGAGILRKITAGASYKFLKVSHHGSKTGLDNVLANQFRGAIAFLPVGDNSYGHPATEVLDMLKAVDARTYCTQRTKYCRRNCMNTGFGSLSLPIGRQLREGWSITDSKRCVNN